MAEEKKNQQGPGADKAPPSAPPPPAPRRARDDDDEDEARDEKVQAARKRLADLKASKELELLEAEIEKIENGGLSPAQVVLKRKAEKVRDATHKVKDRDGKVVAAMYRIPGRSFKGGVLRDDYVLQHPIEKLPGPTWEAVTRAPPKPASEFEKVPVSDDA